MTFYQRNIDIQSWAQIACQNNSKLESHFVEADFEIQNQGHMRQEIEIGLLTLNGNKFVCTITPQEAKFTIYRESLGFEDFTNFDGVRFAFVHLRS